MCTPLRGDSHRGLLARPHLSHRAENIPPAPGVQAPSLPPGLPPGPAPTLPSSRSPGKAHCVWQSAGNRLGWPLAPIDAGTYSCPTGEASRPGNLDGFLDHLFEPVLTPGVSVSGFPSIPSALGLGLGPGNSCPSQALDLTMPIVPSGFGTRLGPEQTHEGRGLYWAHPAGLPHG